MGPTCEASIYEILCVAVTYTRFSKLRVLSVLDVYLLSSVGLGNVAWDCCTGTALGSMAIYH